MPNTFSSGKFAIAECDICGFRYKLKELKNLVIKTKNVTIKACPTCWDPDHPQLQLGMYPVDDPQAVREPRPDVSYRTSGTSGLQLSADDTGTPESGSRIIQWGWAPVGGARGDDAGFTPNNLALVVSIGTVSVAVT